MLYYQLHLIEIVHDIEIIFELLEIDGEFKVFIKPFFGILIFFLIASILKIFLGSKCILNLTYHKFFAKHIYCPIS